MTEIDNDNEWTISREDWAARLSPRARAVWLAAAREPAQPELLMIDGVKIAVVATTKLNKCLRGEKEAAAFLRVRLADVKDWIATGELVASETGTGKQKRLRISPEAIGAFLAARALKPKQRRRRRDPIHPDVRRVLDKIK